MSTTAPAGRHPVDLLHDLLRDLRAEAQARPRRRLHVHPDAAMWITIHIAASGLEPHVRVVQNPAVQRADQGWVETFTADQWAGMRALVGQRVTVTDPRLGALTGVLSSLDDGTAVLDVGDGDHAHVPWITVTAAQPDPAG